MSAAARDTTALICLIAMAWTLEPVAGLMQIVAGLSIAEAHAQTDQSRFYPEAYSSLLRDGEIWLRMAALIIGGFWAYFKFFKGRTFRSRLEPSIRGGTFKRDDQIFAHIVFLTKNVGLSKVELDHETSSIVISIADAADPADHAVSATWDHVATLDAFQKHQWVEPGETIQEERLVLLPGDRPPQLLLELILASGKLRWAAMAVVAREAQEVATNARK